MKPCVDGSLFIDRDGTHFRCILSYLRTGKLFLPEGETFLKEFEEEAEFYQIQGIIDELRSSEPTIQASKPTKPFEESEKKRKKKKKAIDYSMSKELEHVHFSSTQNLENEDQPRNQVLTDAENYIKEACEMVQREATRLRLEQEAIDSMSKKLEHVHFSSTIKLNVGGRHFATCIQTLTKDPNSMLAAMFSRRFDMKPSEDGSFFIDRDGTHFRFILNYLRTGKLILPEGETVLKELEKEAEFYQIQGIIDELRSSEPTIQASKPIKPFEESEKKRKKKKKEIDYSVSKELEHVHFSSTIKLNVGGHHFITSVQTLSKDPNSMLAAMFSGRFDMKPSEDGSFFIDRDGTHFRFILNYLRTGKLILPEGATVLKELEKEAEFYQIQGIIDELRSSEPTIQASKPIKPFEESEKKRKKKKKEIDYSVSKELEHVHFSATIKLNVGGHHFITSVQTLSKDPNSMLAAMFSGRFDMKPSEDGSFFIDRDGTHFRFILNYLHTGKLILPEGATVLKEFEKEAEFYQIQGIIDELRSSEPTIQASKPIKPFEESEKKRKKKKKEIDYSVSKELEHVHFSSTINLNVGGHHFITSVQTLSKDPNSMLAAMFSGRFDMKPSEDGSFFIDRDGTHFRFILNYLRTGKLILPEGATVLKEFEKEAEFYQIQGIIDELRSSEPTIQASKPIKPFEESEKKRKKKKKEIDYSVSKELEHVHFSSTIKLNVGGHHFITSVQTLSKDPNSMLAAMFSGRFDMKPSEDGSFFIDRDGTHFRFILNYLRTGKLILPEGATVLKEFEKEAEFYQIQGIIDELRSSEPTVQASKPTKPFEESEKKRKKKKKEIDYSMSKELEHVHFSSTQTLENKDQQRNQVLTDAENYIKETCEMVQREATRLRLEQEAIDSMLKKLEHVHFSSTIILNVGGHHFSASIQTLTKDPNSMLAAMFFREV